MNMIVEELIFSNFEDVSKFELVMRTINADDAGRRLAVYKNKEKQQLYICIID